MANIFCGLTILLLACIGNAEWWVILVNRRHSLKYRHAQLLRIRRLHDIGIICFPPFLFFYAGLGDSGLLNGGHVLDLPLPLQGILAITLAGTVPLLYCLIRHQFRKPPSNLISKDKVVHDCVGLPSCRSSKSVLGDSQSLLLRIPFNQIFQLEVNTKRLQLGQSGSSPEVVAGSADVSRPLRICHFSDLHFIGTPGPGYHDFVTEQLCELKPDFFVFTGDLLDRMDLLDRARDMFQRLRDVAPGFFVLGNHDWHLDHGTIRDELCSTGWVSVAETHKRESFADYEVLVAGTEAPWIGNNPVVPKRNGEHLRLLLSHAPDQRNFGCDNEFHLMMCGHNHGGQVVLPIIGPIYSPSIYGVKYAGGLYSHRNMLLHVSRGLGAKDLLRWNCQPEITLLELQFDQVRA